MKWALERGAMEWVGVCLNYIALVIYNEYVRTIKNLYNCNMKLEIFYDRIK